MRNSFLFSMLVMASHIVIADGKVEPSEYKFLGNFLKEHFGEEAEAQAAQRPLGDEDHEVVLEPGGPGADGVQAGDRDEGAGQWPEVRVFRAGHGQNVVVDEALREQRAADVRDGRDCEAQDDGEAVPLVPGKDLPRDAAEGPAGILRAGSSRMISLTF